MDSAPNIKEVDIDAMIGVNLGGLVNVTQAVLPIFMARSRNNITGYGDIINIGSIAGRYPYPGASIYCATKAAVRAISDSLRQELISTRIRISVIDPGVVRTEIQAVRFGNDKKKVDTFYQ
jgi:3-hydroxy acid dehydrogenase/malonic semialdehyde reductase